MYLLYISIQFCALFVSSLLLNLHANEKCTKKINSYFIHISLSQICFSFLAISFQVCIIFVCWNSYFIICAVALWCNKLDEYIKYLLFQRYSTMYILYGNNFTDEYLQLLMLLCISWILAWKLLMNNKFSWNFIPFAKTNIIVIQATSNTYT